MGPLFSLARNDRTLELEGNLHQLVQCFYFIAEEPNIRVMCYCLEFTELLSEAGPVWREGSIPSGALPCFLLFHEASKETANTHKVTGSSSSLSPKVKKLLQ